MLLFSSGSNTFDIVVEEKRTIASAKYLFIFTNDLTGKKVACTSTEVTVDGIRSQFTITVQGTPTPLSAQIYLYNLGFYKYFVYERTAVQIAAFNYATVDALDLRTLTGLVDNGKLKFTATATVDAYYKDVQPSVKNYII
jgi:hypothetical protein